MRGAGGACLPLDVLPEQVDEIWRWTLGEVVCCHVADAMVARRTGARTLVEAVVPAVALAAGASRIALRGQGGADAATQQWMLEVRKGR